MSKSWHYPQWHCSKCCISFVEDELDEGGVEGSLLCRECYAEANPPVNCTCKEPYNGRVRITPSANGGYHVECQVCGGSVEVPPFATSKIADLPRWFYWLAYGLGILTAIAFLIVLAHEILRPHH